MSTRESIRKDLNKTLHKIANESNECVYIEGWGCNEVTLDGTFNLKELLLIIDAMVKAGQEEFSLANQQSNV